MWMMKKLFSFFVSFLFPSECYLCHKEGSCLCDTCILTLPKPVDTPAPFITSLYSFKDHRIRKIIHAAKYFHRKDLLLTLGSKLSQELKSSNLTFDLIIPIPMPKMREYIRGYNQAEILARTISDELGIPCSKDILLRDKQKSRQVLARTRKARLRNQKHAFIIKKTLTQKNILLVDDVTTTGATLFEARRELISHGAITVHAITVAH